MNEADDPLGENESLRNRPSSSSTSSLRITEELDFDRALQGVLDGARSLTGAKFGAVILVDDSGQVEELLSSGFPAEDARRLRETNGGALAIEGLTGVPGPLRVRDLRAHIRSQGLPELPLPWKVSEELPCLTAPIRHGGERVGSIFVAGKEAGREFSLEDEETLVLFASLASLVGTNARRRQTEQWASANLETVIDTSPVGVLVLDAALGVPLMVNREARRIVSSLHGPDDYAEEILEVVTVRRSDGRELSLERLSLAQALSVGEVVRAEEVVIGVPDGRTVTALVNATPIRSENGEVESVVVIMQDMAPLDEAVRQRAEFLDMVSHELRTPLTSIRGSADTLLDDGSSLDPAETRQFHRIIVEQVDRMRRLMSDLLDVARIEAGTLPVSSGPTEVGVLVDDAKDSFLNAGWKNDLPIDLAPDLPLVMADRRRTVQVIDNLLSYASMHSSEASAIRVAAGRRGVDVEVSVAAAASGIPADQLAHLFRRSSRIKTDNRGIDGGLSLAVCKGIVEAQGGRIWAESDDPGLGFRFTFTLPAVERAAAVVSETGPTSSTRAPQAGKGPSLILVVGDDPQTLRYVRDVLSSAGYATTVTADPEDVPRLMKEQEPWLVLLDLTLQGTDAVMLIKSVRDMAETPVVLLAAYGQDHVISRAFELGAADYVVKPFSPTELTARIQAALRRQVASAYEEPAAPYRLGDLTVDYAQRTVSVAGRRVELTDLEYRVLAELSANAGRVITHKQLLLRVWGLGKSRDAGPVRNIVKRLRSKLVDDADSPKYIHTAPRVGYHMAKEREPERTVP